MNVQKSVPADMWAMSICSLQQMLCVLPMRFNTTLSSSLFIVSTLSQISGFPRVSCHKSPYELLLYLWAIDRCWVHKRVQIYLKPQIHSITVRESAGHCLGLNILPTAYRNSGGSKVVPYQAWTTRVVIDEVPFPTVLVNNTRKRCFTALVTLL